MELTENTLQKLRLLREHGFNAIEDLNEKYFIKSYDEIEAENVLKLLNENICSFREIVDKFQSIKDENDRSCLYRLLENKEVFKFDLTNDQKLELAEILINNELAKNRLIQIIENNLESNYDFDSLMRYLKKKEKRGLLNI